MCYDSKGPVEMSWIKNISLVPCHIAWNCHSYLLNWLD